MIVLSCVFALALVAVVYVFLRYVQQHDERTAVERRELLERIQRPELVPLSHRPDFHEPEIEPDEIGLVGTIQDPPEE